MTDVNASVMANVIERFASATADTDHDTSEYTLGAKLVLGAQRYKNRGWFSGAQEVWLSFDAPNATPPSGHSLALVDHVVLEF